MTVPLDDTSGHGADAWASLGLSGPASPVGGAVGPGVLLGRVCDLMLRKLQVSGAAVGLTAPGDAEAWAASSGPQALAHAQLEFDLGEGPARHAYDTGRVVIVPDMAGPDAHAWPGYAAAARQAGIGAQFAFPLQLGAVRLGVLVAFQDTPRRLSRAEVSDCLVCAEAATWVVLDSPGTPADSGIDPGLSAPPSFRAEVFQAQGMVAAAGRVSLAVALALLRATAFRTERDLTGVCRDVVAGRLSITENDP